MPPWQGLDGAAAHHIAGTLLPNVWSWGPILRRMAVIGAPPVRGRCIAANVAAGTLGTLEPHNLSITFLASPLLRTPNHAVVMVLLVVLGIEATPFAEAVQAVVQAWLPSEAQPGADSPGSDTS